MSPFASVHLNRREAARAIGPRNAPSAALVVGDPVFHRPSEAERAADGVLARAGEGGNMEQAVAAVMTTDQVRLFGEGSSRLPGTAREVEQIARVIEATGDTAVKIVGEDATVPQREANATAKRLLHFASHGLWGSSERPYDASIALTQPKTPTPDDIGFLRLDDLIRRWRGAAEGLRSGRPCGVPHSRRREGRGQHPCRCPGGSSTQGRQP